MSLSDPAITPLKAYLSGSLLDKKLKKNITIGTHYEEKSSLTLNQLFQFVALI